MASGRPTTAQANRAVVPKPPLPMPKDPYRTDELADAVFGLKRRDLGILHEPFRRDRPHQDVGEEAEHEHAREDGHGAVIGSAICLSVA